MSANTANTEPNNKTSKRRSGNGLRRNPATMQDWDEARNAAAGNNPDTVGQQVARIVSPPSSSGNKRTARDDDDADDDGTAAAASSGAAIIPKRRRTEAASSATVAEADSETISAMPVVFFNITTGAVAYVASSQKVTAEILGVQADTVSRKLSLNDRSSVWLAPHWGCYRVLGDDVVSAVDSKERERFLAALSARPGGLPSRAVKSYRVLCSSGARVPCEDLKSVCNLLRVPKAQILELFRQAPSNSDTTIIGPINEHWRVEQTIRQEPIIIV